MYFTVINRNCQHLLERLIFRYTIATARTSPKKGGQA